MLVRAQLWPASPSYPRYAFSFKLLDWAESLLLECQVALKDFCQALYFRCPYTTITVSVHALNDCYIHIVCWLISAHPFLYRDEIYILALLMLLRSTGSNNYFCVMLLYNIMYIHVCRFFRHEMRCLSFLSESLDPGNVCPACPRVSYSIL